MDVFVWTVCNVCNIGQMTDRSAADVFFLEAFCAGLHSLSNMWLLCYKQLWQNLQVQEIAEDDRSNGQMRYGFKPVSSPCLVLQQASLVPALQGVLLHLSRRLSIMAGTCWKAMTCEECPGPSLLTRLAKSIKQLS